MCWIVRTVVADVSYTLHILYSLSEVSLNFRENSSFQRIKPAIFNHCQFLFIHLGKMPILPHIQIFWYLPC